jgi:hypothetical protein
MGFVSVHTQCSCRFVRGEPSKVDLQDRLRIDQIHARYQHECMLKCADSVKPIAKTSKVMVSSGKNTQNVNLAYA